MKVTLPHDSFRLALAVTALAALMLLTPTAAAAHTRAELDDWVAAWTASMDESIGGGLLAELDDMQQLHPYYWQTPEDRRYAHTHAGARSSARTGAGGAQVERWRPLVVIYFDATDVTTAMCLIAAESGGNPNAKNPRSSAAGLFQFLRSTWNSVPVSVSGGSYESGRVYEPEPNIAAAAWLERRSGWTQWTPYNRGLCH